MQVVAQDTYGDLAYFTSMSLQGTAWGGAVAGQCPVQGRARDSSPHPLDMGKGLSEALQAMLRLGPRSGMHTALRPDQTAHHIWLVLQHIK